jgi:hypothetical protein
MVEYKKTPLGCAYPRKVELTDLIDLLGDSHKSYPLLLQCMPYHHYLLNEDVECWIAQFFREYCDCSELPYSVKVAFLQRSFLYYQA